MTPDVGSAAASGAAAAAALVPGEPVSIAVDERLAVRLNKDGGMENMEVQGTMSLQVSTSCMCTQHCTTRIIHHARCEPEPSVTRM